MTKLSQFSLCALLLTIGCKGVNPDYSEYPFDPVNDMKKRHGTVLHHEDRDFKAGSAVRNTNSVAQRQAAQGIKPEESGGGNAENYTAELNEERSAKLMFQEITAILSQEYPISFVSQDLLMISSDWFSFKLIPLKFSIAVTQEKSLKPSQKNNKQPYYVKIRIFADSLRAHKSRIASISITKKQFSQELQNLLGKELQYIYVE